MTTTNTYDYFIATRWRNRDLVIALTKKIRSAGKTVYSFLEKENVKDDVGQDPEVVMRAYEQNADWASDSRVQEIFQQDLKGLKQSESVILLLPAGKSAHMEAGVAYGLGKKLVLIGQVEAAESLYLLFNERFNAIDDFIAAIKN